MPLSLLFFSCKPLINVVTFNYYHTEFGKVNMVSWKVALAVIVLAVLLMAIGVWFGYRYVSEQDDISPAGWREPANTVFPSGDKPLVVLAAQRENAAGQYCIFQTL